MQRIPSSREMIGTMTTGKAEQGRVAIVMCVGPGKRAALDTLESIEVFCPEPHVVVVVDDHTTDGTYEAITAAKRPYWHLLRNSRQHGVPRLVHSLCLGYDEVLTQTNCQLILRLDQDALIIKPGLIPEALTFMEESPGVGLFGVYEDDYNRPRDFEVHRRLLDKEAGWVRSLIGRQPSWKGLLRRAERNGYRRGENVFGGAYFVTRRCLDGIKALGGLGVPWNWHSELPEDVYFSMAAVAAGFRLGHFAAPDGPLWLEWRGLPYPAAALASSKAKLVHSVDKGPNTGPLENAGRTAREVFREFRRRMNPGV